MRRVLEGLASPLAAIALAIAPAHADEPAKAPPPASRWCAEELEALGDATCFYAPSTEALKKAPAPGRTLVIFLHSLVGEGSTWQWDQQRLMVRTAENHGLYALVPRGRLGIGPGRDPKVFAWPTAKKFQETLEDGIVAEWLTAKERVEKRLGGAFDRVFVFGFSNGAYYASSLALRGRLQVDGYGIFAGGSGGKYGKLLGRQTKNRVPIFVGYGTKDPDHRRQKELVATLEDLDWKHRSRADRIGHTVSNAQIRAALEFLTAPTS